MLPKPYDHDRIIGTRRTRQSMVVFILSAVVALATIALWSSRGGSASPDADRTAPVEPHLSGTSGQHTTDGENSGPALTTVAALQPMRRGEDLVGRRVQLSMPVERHVNDVAFWIGSGDEQLLVVLVRDTRDGTERQTGRPADRQPEGEVISGTIERLPHAEAMFSWGLTNADVARLKERPVYVRAVVTAPFTANPIGR